MTITDKLTKTRYTHVVEENVVINPCREKSIKKELTRGNSCSDEKINIREIADDKDKFIAEDYYYNLEDYYDLDGECMSGECTRLFDVSLGAHDLRLSFKSYGKEDDRGDVVSAILELHTYPNPAPMTRKEYSYDPARAMFFERGKDLQDRICTLQRERTHTKVVSETYTNEWGCRTSRLTNIESYDKPGLQETFLRRKLENEKLKTRVPCDISNINDIRYAFRGIKEITTFLDNFFIVTPEEKAAYMEHKRRKNLGIWNDKASKTASKAEEPKMSLASKLEKFCEKVR